MSSAGDLLRKSRVLPIVVLCIGLPVASVALYLGTMIISMSTGWLAIGNYVRDRFIGAGCLILAILLNMLMVRMLGLTNRGMPFWLRCGLSFGATLSGATLIYAVIWRGLWPLFDR